MADETIVEPMVEGTQPQIDGVQVNRDKMSKMMAGIDMIKAVGPYGVSGR